MDALAGKRVGIGGLALLPPLTGVGRYTFHLAHEMQALLAEKPMFFYARQWSAELRPMAVPATAAVRGSIARWVPHAWRAARWLQQRRFTAGARANGIALYHEPNYLAFRFDGPTVVTVHDLSWIRYPQMHPAVRVRMMDAIMPRVARDAARIVADSEFTRREVIEHYGVAAERVSAVLLGVTGEFRPLAVEACAAALAARGLVHGRYILAVGTLEPRKNLATAIAAFARLPEAVRRSHPLVVAGMSGWGRDRFAPTVRDMIARGEVRITGYIAQEELPMLYSGARIFVYPSVYEGFGLPPLEAMACGVPVIVSRRASLPEVVGEAGVLVEGLDEVELAERMQALIDDDALHARLAVAGIDRARSFTWRRCAEGTLEVYRGALAA